MRRLIPILFAMILFSACAGMQPEPARQLTLEETLRLAEEAGAGKKISDLSQETNIQDTDEVLIRRGSNNYRAQVQHLPSANPSDQFNQIKNAYYVSTNASVTDHGDTAQSGSIADVITNEMSGVNGDLILPGNKTYQIKQTFTIPTTVRLIPQKGAIIDTNISIRDANYKWTLSGSGTNEYYLEAAAGGNPNINEPDDVGENDALMTEATVGWLSAGEWDWGNNDTLGFNTVYVRLSDSTDPDGKATDYVEACYTLTINGAFDAGDYRVFNGDVTISGLLNFNIRWVGAVPNDIGEAATNEIAVSAAISCGGDIIIDDTYYIEKETAHTFNNSFRLVGINGGTLIFTTYTQEYFGKISDVDYVELDNLKITNNADTLNRIFTAVSDTTWIGRMIVSDCSFSNYITIFRQSYSDTVDPGVTQYGIGEIVFKNNFITNNICSFFVATNAQHEIIIIKNNTVRDVGYVVFNIGAENAHTYIDELRAAMKMLTAEGNSVVNRDNLFLPGTGGTYIAFILYEGTYMTYRNNWVEGLKSTDLIAIYDVYASSDELHYSDNMWKNNLCINSAKANNELMKSKGALISYYDNNTFIMEKDFVVRHGGDVVGKDWVTMIQKSVGDAGSVLSITNNYIDVYVLLGMSSSEFTKDLFFENNIIKVGKFSSFFINISNTKLDSYTGALVRIINNVLDIDTIETITRNGTPYAPTGFVFMTYVESGKGEYENITIRNNQVNINDAQISFTLMTELKANEVNCTDNTYIIGDSVNFRMIYDDLCSNSNYSGNVLKLKTGYSDTSIVQFTAERDARFLFGYGYEGLYRFPFSYLSAPTVDDFNVTVRFEATYDGVKYSGAYRLKITPTHVHYTDAAGNPQNTAYAAGPTNVAPKMYVLNASDALITGIGVVVYNLTVGAIRIDWDATGMVLGVTEIKTDYSIEVF